MQPKGQPHRVQPVHSRSNVAFAQHVVARHNSGVFHSQGLHSLHFRAAAQDEPCLQGSPCALVPCTLTRKPPAPLAAECAVAHRASRVPDPGQHVARAARPAGVRGIRVEQNPQSGNMPLELRDLLGCVMRQCYAPTLTLGCVAEAAPLTAPSGNSLHAAQDCFWAAAGHTRPAPPDCWFPPPPLHPPPRRRMLVKDPGQRVSMPGIMSHPWFQKVGHIGLPLGVVCCVLTAPHGLPAIWAPLGRRVLLLTALLGLPANWAPLGRRALRAPSSARSAADTPCLQVLLALLLPAPLLPNRALEPKQRTHPPACCAGAVALQNMPPGLPELNSRVDPEAASRQVRLPMFW